MNSRDKQKDSKRLGWFLWLEAITFLILILAVAAVTAEASTAKTYEQGVEDGIKMEQTNRGIFLIEFCITQGPSIIEMTDPVTKVTYKFICAPMIDGYGTEEPSEGT